MSFHIRFVVTSFLVSFLCGQINNSTVLLENAFLNNITGEMQFWTKDYVTTMPMTLSFWIKVGPGKASFGQMQPFMKLVWSGNLIFKLTISYISSGVWSITDNTGAFLRLETMAATTDGFSEFNRCTTDGDHWISFVINIVSTLAISSNVFMGIGMVFSASIPGFLSSPVGYLSLLGPTGIANPMDIMISNLIIHKSTYTYAQQTPNGLELLRSVGAGWLMADYESLLEFSDNSIPDLTANFNSSLSVYGSDCDWKVFERATFPVDSKLVLGLWKRTIFFESDILPRSPVDASYVFVIELELYAEHLYISKVKAGYAGPWPSVPMTAYKRYNSTGGLFSYELDFDTGGRSLRYDLLTKTGLNKTASNLGLNPNTFTAPAPVHPTKMLYLILSSQSGLMDADLIASFYPAPLIMKTTIATNALSPTDTHVTSSGPTTYQPWITFRIASFYFLRGNQLNPSPSYANRFTALASVSAMVFPGQTTMRTLVASQNYKMLVQTDYSLSATITAANGWCYPLANCDLCFASVCFRCQYHYAWNGSACVLCNYGNDSGFVYDGMSQKCVAASAVCSTVACVESFFDYLAPNNILLISVYLAHGGAASGTSAKVYVFNTNSLMFSPVNPYPQGTIREVNIPVNASVQPNTYNSTEIGRIKTWFASLSASVLISDPSLVTNYTVLLANMSTSAYQSMVTVPGNVMHLSTNYLLAVDGYSMVTPTQYTVACPNGQTYDFCLNVCSATTPVNCSQQIVPANATANVTANVTSNATANATNQTSVNATDNSSNATNLTHNSTTNTTDNTTNLTDNNSSASTDPSPPNQSSTPNTPNPSAPTYKSLRVTPMSQELVKKMESSGDSFALSLVDLLHTVLQLSDDHWFYSDQTKFYMQGCIRGRFLSGGECLNCSRGCAVCANTLTCVLCFKNYNLHLIFRVCLLKRYVIDPYVYKANTTSVSVILSSNATSALCTGCNQSFYSILDTCLNCLTVCDCKKVWDHTGRIVTVNCPRITFNLRAFESHFSTDFYFLPSPNSSSFQVQLQPKAHFGFYRLNPNAINETKECIYPQTMFVFGRQIQLLTPNQNVSTAKKILSTAVENASIWTSFSSSLAVFLIPLLAFNKFFSFLLAADITGGTYYDQVNSYLRADSKNLFQKIPAEDLQMNWQTFVSVNKFDKLLRESELYMFVLITVLIELLGFANRLISHFAAGRLPNIYFWMSRLLRKFSILYLISNSSVGFEFIRPVLVVLPLASNPAKQVFLVVCLVQVLRMSIDVYLIVLHNFLAKGTYKLIMLRQFEAPKQALLDLAILTSAAVDSAFLGLKIIIVLTLNRFCHSAFILSSAATVLEMPITWRLFRERSSTLLSLRLLSHLIELLYITLVFLPKLGKQVPNSLLNLVYVAGNLILLFQMLYKLGFLLVENWRYKHRIMKVDLATHRRSTLHYFGVMRVEDD